MENTDRLNLPYLMAAQAQKHVTHNEALRMLDALVHLSVSTRNLSVPPSEPEHSEAFLVGTEGSGAWEGQDGNIAVFVDGFWMFHTVQEGWLLWISDESVFVIYNGTEWVAPPVPNTLNNLAQVGVGTSSDTTNKLAVASNASLFTHNGASHQVKINKNSDADTASVLFQTGFSGRAEFGTTGDDDWHVKTSSDSSVWNEAIVAKAETGSVSFPNGANLELLAPPTDEAGGESFAMGPPCLHTVSYGRSNFGLVKNRIIFSVFHVDRPTELLGGAIAQYAASTDTGSVLRAGVYKLGEANGNSWNVGDLVADFGSLPADSQGHKIFDLATPTTLLPGWYLNAIGCNGTAAQIRFYRWMIPGLLQYAPFGSGGGTDFRTSGPGVYMYENAMSSAIADGLPSSWSTNPVTIFSTTSSFIYQTMLPKWTRWH